MTKLVSCIIILVMESLARIPVASYIFFGVFFAFSIWHIVLCVIRQQSFLRKATKSCCVLSLAIAVCIAVPTYPLLYLGLFCGAIGDFLLIFKRKPVLFVLGAVFFLANHILFLIQGAIMILPNVENPTWGIVIYLAIAYVIAYIIAYKMLRKPKRAIPGGIYVTALLCNVGLYALACFQGRVAYFLVCLFGAFSFLASDMLLAYSLFVKGNQKIRHLVMASYLIAQFLISFGFVLTILA